MDSKQLVNDIVNKRFSKARDTIHEELVNRIVTKVESMGPETGSAAIHEALGILKKGLAIAGGAGLLGKGVKFLKKRFSKKGREDARKRKEEKGIKKDEKSEDKAARKKVQEILDGLRKDLEAASDDEEREKITLQMNKIKDNAIKAGVGYKKFGDIKGDSSYKKYAKGERKAASEKKVSSKIARIKGDKSADDADTSQAADGGDTSQAADGGETAKPAAEPTVDVDAIKQKIEGKQKEIAEIRADLTKLVDKGTGDRSEEDDAKIENHNQSIAQREEDIEVLKKQLPQDTEEDKTE